MRTLACVSQTTVPWALWVFRISVPLTTDRNVRCKKKREVCAVWVFSHGSPPLGCPHLVDHLKHSNFASSHRELFFPMPPLLPPGTRPPAIPFRRRRRWVCLFCSSCILWSLLMLFDNFYCQMILGVLHYWHSVSFTLLLAQPFPKSICSRTIFAKMITDLTRCSLIVFELKWNCNVCNFTQRRFFWINMKL